MVIMMVTFSPVFYGGFDSFNGKKLPPTTANYVSEESKLHAINQLMFVPVSFS